MGTLARFNLREMRARYGLVSFVETGTASGDSVEIARHAGFDQVHSIEIVPQIADAARARFTNDARVRIWTGDSREVLPDILATLPAGPCLFWLDAHFPGAHPAGDYEAEKVVERRLPLAAEVAIIAAARPDAHDVLLVDDARIYQDGEYGAGSLPPDWPPLRGIKRSLDFLRTAYARTHGIVVDYADQGYVMVCPRLAASSIPM